MPVRLKIVRHLVVFFLSYGLILLISVPKAKAGDFGSCLFDHHSPSVGDVEYTFYWGTDPTENDTLQGSGFIVSSDGYVLTANHVLDWKERYPSATIIKETVKVYLNSITFGKPLDAEIKARNSKLDIAILKLPDSGRPYIPVPLGNSTGIGIDSQLTGLAFPLGGDLSIVPTAPVVARYTIVGGVHGQVQPWWQTRLGLDEGDSGGPIFGNLGTVVGIAVRKKTNLSMISYVIPIDNEALKFLKEEGVVSEVQASGDCAEYPLCRRVSHGLEGWGSSVETTEQSELMDHPLDRWAYCDKVVEDLRRAHPEAEIHRQGADEASQPEPVEPGKPRAFKFRYSCAILTLSDPRYREVRGKECLTDQP